MLLIELANQSALDVKNNAKHLTILQGSAGKRLRLRLAGPPTGQGVKGLCGTYLGSIYSTRAISESPVSQGNCCAVASRGSGAVEGVV